MAAIYPRLWKESFGSALEIRLAKFEWARELQHLDSLVIEGAIRLMNASGSEFPPSLPKFISYARQAEEQLSPKGYKVFGRG
jgi:hypothetical protein